VQRSVRPLGKHLPPPLQAAAVYCASPASITSQPTVSTSQALSSVSSPASCLAFQPSYWDRKHDKDMISMGVTGRTAWPPCVSPCVSPVRLQWKWRTRWTEDCPLSTLPLSISEFILSLSSIKYVDISNVLSILLMYYLYYLLSGYCLVGTMRYEVIYI